MKTTIEWFYRDNKVYKVLPQILTRCCIVKEYRIYESLEFETNPEVVLFEVYNRFLYICKLLREDTKHLDTDVICQRLYTVPYPTDDVKLECILIYLLLYYQYKATGDEYIKKFIEKCDSENHNYKECIIKAEKLDEYSKNIKPCTIPSFGTIDYSSFTYNDWFWITDKFTRSKIEEVITEYKQINPNDNVGKNIREAWEFLAFPRSLHGYVNSYFFDKINKTYPQEQEAEYESLIIDEEYASHYPDINIDDYSDYLIDEIEELYNNGNKDKARELWAKCYCKIEKYELQIKSDWNLICNNGIDLLKDEYGNKYGFNNAEESARAKYNHLIQPEHIILNLALILQRYHCIVEPYNRINGDTQLQKHRWKAAQCMYLVHYAGIYKEAKAIEWGALLHLLTGYSENTIRQDIGKYYNETKLLNESEKREVERAYDEVMEGLRNRNKKK